MRPDLTYIATALKAYDPQLRYTNKNTIDAKITHVQAVEKIPEKTASDVVYLLRCSALPKKKPAHLPGNLICVQDKPCPEWVMNSKELNAAVTDYEVTEELVAETILAVQAVQRRLSRASDAILEALYSGQGLQAIMDIGAELLGKVVAVLDTNWKVLAVSKAPEPVNSRIIDVLRSGYMDNLLVETMKEKGFLDSLRRNGQFAYFPPEEGDPGHGWYCRYVRVNGVVAGYLVVHIGEEAFEDYHPEWVSKLAKYVTMELQKGRDTTSVNAEACESLLLDLLKRKITDQLVLRRRMELLDQSLEKYLHVISVKKMAKSQSIALSSVERSRIREMFPGSMSVVYDKKLVLLVSSKDGSIPVRADMETLQQDLQSSDLIAGVSNTFTNVAEAARYYNQSAKAVDFSWNISAKGGLYHYSDYAVYHALDICVQQVDLQDLCHPVVRALQDSDDLGDKDLLQTLYLYLIYMKDADRVSKAMNIHRSTLFYRLNKIKSLVGSDLNDGNIVFQLLFSFKMIEYMDIFSPDKSSSLPPKSE